MVPARRGRTGRGGARRNRQEVRRARGSDLLRGHRGEAELARQEHAAACRAGRAGRGEDLRGQGEIREGKSREQEHGALGRSPARAAAHERCQIGVKTSLKGELRPVRRTSALSLIEGREVIKRTEGLIARGASEVES